MPKHWLYYIALMIPLIVALLIYHTGFVDWVWYQGHKQSYFALAAMRDNSIFREFFGGWSWPIFVLALSSYWHFDDDADHTKQFILVPLLFTPIAVMVGLVSNSLDVRVLYSYPLIIVPLGYLYIGLWMMCVWAFEKCRLVV